MKPVCVLGHRGMLGHVVVRYLKESGFEVVTIDERFEIGNAIELIEQINQLNPGWCVNCIGVRAGGGRSDEWVDFVNHRVPALCSHHLRTDCGLVHASSDGVFVPDSGPCDWSRWGDEDDLYGCSKWRGERALLRGNDWIIRCSLVGPELGNARSLLGWLMTQSEVDGYSNQFWNGITSLQWAKICAAVLVREYSHAQRLLQPASEEILTKAELLRRLITTWKLECQVNPVAGPIAVTRTLIPNIATEAFDASLAELKAWY